MIRDVLGDRSASSLTQDVLRRALEEKDILTAISDVATALQCLRTELDAQTPYGARPPQLLRPEQRR